MKIAGLVLLAIAAGWGASELLYRLPVFHEAIERFAPQSDERRLARKLRDASRGEAVSAEAIEREMALLRAQFADEAAFAGALKVSHLKEETLRAQLTENLRERAWLEKQIDLAVSEEEARAAYAAEEKAFARPVRFRARHIFLAAPDGSPAEVIAAKQSAIQGIAIRILGGEKFEDLVAETSEDEATKNHQGDLGYFAADRMPPEFMTEIVKLQAGEQSPPFRSHLGFHIVQLIEVKPPEKIAYEAARPEIQVSLGNAKRALVVARLSEQLRQP